MTACVELSARVGVASACRALQVPRASYYRARQPRESPPNPRPTPPRALSQDDRARVRAILNSERFRDLAVREVFATLIDEGVYLCSWRTMYRILAAHDEVRERRKVRDHRDYPVPQLVAVGPNQVWSWDITKLRGPAPGVFYHLYVILDIFSRYVVAWMVAERELDSLAAELIDAAYDKQGVRADQLTLHADRGSSMRSNSVTQLLVRLGVVKSHSRPYVSDDNPYSESQFKTLKHHPSFPGRFGACEDARAHCRVFFPWYNDDHYHTGLGLLTPSDVHHGRVDTKVAARQQVLLAAYESHPERFTSGPPTAARPPQQAWINPPAIQDRLQNEVTDESSPKQLTDESSRQ